MIFKNFSRIALLSFGAMMTMVSCNNEEVTENNKEPNISFKVVNLEEEEYDNFVKSLANDTSVADFASIDGANIEDNGLKSHSSQRVGGYLIDMYGSYGATAAKSGYERLTLDLNMGAGGAYVYLYVKTSYSDWQNAIENIYGDYNYIPNESSSVDKKTKKVFSVYKNVKDANGSEVIDFNKGTKGGRITLSYAKNVNNTNHARRIRAITAVAYKSAANNQYGDYTKTASYMDLNQGAGGRYIYLFTKTMNLPSTSMY